MADSFRAARAQERDAAAAIEERFSHLTAGDEPPPDKTKRGGKRLLTEVAERDENFRIACGAFVKDKVKPGVRQKYDLDAAKRLRAEGADVDSRDGDGWSALQMAVMLNQLPAAQLLLNRGADPSLPNSLGITPVIMASGESHDYCCQVAFLSTLQQQSCGQATKSRCRCCGC